MDSSRSESSTIVIRPAEARDGELIYTFLCELEEQLLDPVAFQSAFQHNLTDADVHYLVAEAADTVVGFVSCHMQYLLHHAGRVGEIQELFVAATHRNQRVGRRLVGALDTLAREQGLVNLEVTTNRIRSDTHRFYEGLGFAPTHYKFVKVSAVP